MANAQATTKEKMNAWKERCLTMCSCGEDIVVYQCIDSQCPYNMTDPLFCVPCLANFDKHQHNRPPMIYDKIMELDKEQNNQKEAFKGITERATERYKEFEPLIRYFEHEMLIASFSSIPDMIPKQVRQISEDYKKLHRSH